MVYNMYFYKSYLVMNKPRIKRWIGDWWICEGPDGKFGVGHTPTRAYEFWLYPLDEMVRRIFPNESYCSRIKVNPL